MAQVLIMISNIAFVLAAISLVAAVICWFKLNILEVYGDLSGRTAKKSIEQIRESNAKGNRKTYQSSPVNKSRGKLTAAMSGALKREPGKEKTAKPPEPSKLQSSRHQFAETGLLSENKAHQAMAPETEQLMQENDKTPLSEDTGQHEAYETMALDERMTAEPLQMIDEIVSVHTDESI